MPSPPLDASSAFFSSNNLPPRFRHVFQITSSPSPRGRRLCFTVDIAIEPPPSPFTSSGLPPPGGRWMRWPPFFFFSLSLSQATSCNATSVPMSHFPGKCLCASRNSCRFCENLSFLPLYSPRLPPLSMDLSRLLLSRREEEKQASELLEKFALRVALVCFPSAGIFKSERGFFRVEEGKGEGDIDASIGGWNSV